MGKPLIQYKKTELYTHWVDEYELFENYYDLLVFLAVLGHYEEEVVESNYAGSRRDDTRSEAGLQNVYSKDLYRSILACLAYDYTGDPEALVDSSTQMTVLAKYAAGGLNVVEEQFGDVSGDPTDALVNYLRDSRSEEDDIGGELKKIVESFDDEMMAGTD